jgi:hypothetical protein
MHRVRSAEGTLSGLPDGAAVPCSPVGLAEGTNTGLGLEGLDDRMTRWRTTAPTPASTTLAVSVHVYLQHSSAAARQGVCVSVHGCVPA